MTTPQTISDTLHEAPLRGHLVNFYDDPIDLATRVADFAEPALRGSEAVVMIALPTHLSLFRDALRNRGLTVAYLEHAGQLKCLDAEATLEQITLNQKMYWGRFESTVGTTIHTLSRRYGKVRAYGEMVNVLWAKGFVTAALELERFWNQLSVRYPFCLFCAYSLDVLDSKNYSSALSSICRTHSHSFASSIDQSFGDVIQQAINDVLDPGAINALEITLRTDEMNDSHISPSLKTLLWLSDHMPKVAAQVLSKARASYRSSRV